MLDQIILKHINQIITERKQENKYPHHALYNQLVVRSQLNREQLNKELKRLREQSKITRGRTINDFWIKTNY